MFQSDNLEIIRRLDKSHILKVSGNKLTYEVPMDGFYKVKLDNVKIELKQPYLRRIAHDLNNTQFYYVSCAQNNRSRSFNNTSVELKLVRTKDEMFNLSTATMDNSFYRNNQNQAIVHKFATNSTDPNYYKKNQHEIQDIEGSTCIDSQCYSFPIGNSTNFIDIKQNPSLLCGLAWGKPSKNNYEEEQVETTEDYSRSNRTILEYRNYQHRDEQWCNPIAIKHGKSWDSSNLDTILAVTENKLGYTNGMHKINLDNGKASAIMQDRYKGEGTISQIIWLNAGEKITLINCADIANQRDSIHQEIEFTLEIELFSPNKEWLTDKINAETGSSKEPIDFNSPIQFKTDSIDLMKFQPSEIKIDDWVSNFCKAFNLELLHTGKDEFELNIKNQNSLNRISSRIIDLDKKANVWQASNENMSLPSSYDLGFTINTSEQGYSKSFKENNIEDGGGKFSTGSNEPKTIKQTSNFSYCWYETLPKTNKQVPNLTEKEVWEPGKSEKEANSKKYFNSAQRFWYPTKKTQQVMLYGNTPVDLALVSNTYKGDKTLELNYEDKPNSIMRNYFMLLTNERNYTSVECFLSPEEYADLGNSYIKFNGDLYIVAEADGYDPMGKSKTKLKLIKKM